MKRGEISSILTLAVLGIGGYWVYSLYKSGSAGGASALKYTFDNITAAPGTTLGMGGVRALAQADGINLGVPDIQLQPLPSVLV